MSHLNQWIISGYMMEKGIGQSIDVLKAMSWYQLAAEQGEYARAQNCLGYLYYHGADDGSIEKDFQEAVKWFRLAAEQGSSHAQNNLGICYEEGRGVVRDYAKAKELYREASDAHHSSATNNLGYIFLLEKNYDEAIRMFYLAATLGRYLMQN
jgi:tetratricopeptide (TPR) repeat protein